MSATALAALLDATGLTDSEVSRRTGIHSSLISRYRTGDRRPSQNHQELLCRFLECTPAELLGSASDTIGATDLLEPEGWID